MTCFVYVTIKMVKCLMLLIQYQVVQITGNIIIRNVFSYSQQGKQQYYCNARYTVPLENIKLIYETGSMHGDTFSDVSQDLMMTEKILQQCKGGQISSKNLISRHKLTNIFRKMSKRESRSFSTFNNHYVVKPKKENHQHFSSIDKNKKSQ